MQSKYVSSTLLWCKWLEIIRNESTRKSFECLLWHERSFFLLFLLFLLTSIHVTQTKMSKGLYDVSCFQDSFSFKRTLVYFGRPRWGRWPDWHICEVDLDLATCLFWASEARGILKILQVWIDHFPVQCL